MLIYRAIFDDLRRISKYNPLKKKRTSDKAADELGGADVETTKHGNDELNVDNLFAVMSERGMPNQHIAFLRTKLLASSASSVHRDDSFVSGSSSSDKESASESTLKTNWIVHFSQFLQVYESFDR